MAQIITDTFIDTAGVLLQNHVSNNYKSWTKNSKATTDFVISAGVVAPAVLSKDCIYGPTTQPTSNDQTVTLDFYHNSTASYIGLWLRCDSLLATNAYIVQFNAGQFQLLKKSAGTTSSMVIRSPTTTFPIGEWYRVTFSAIGTQISSSVYRYSTGQYIDGNGGVNSAPTNWISITDSTVTSGGSYVSFYTAGDLLGRFRNVTISDGTPGNPAGMLKRVFQQTPTLFKASGASLNEFTQTLGALGYVGGNLAANDWLASPWTNIVLNSRGMSDLTFYGEGGVTVDADGWPTAACRMVVCTWADGYVLTPVTGVYKGRFTWQGTIGTMGSTLTNCTVSNVVTVGQVTTFDLTATGGMSCILEWTQGIKNLEIVYPGYDINNYPHLTTEAVAYYKQFSIIRAMDFMSTNNSTETTWALRPPGTKKSGGKKTWEGLFTFIATLMAASGSETKGVWICLPHQSDSNYWTQVATLAKAMLPANAITYWEYSNETENTLFAQEGWLRTAAKAEVALGGSTLAGGTEYDQRSKLLGRKTWQMAQAVLGVYGQQALNVTVRPVLASLFVDATANPVSALDQINTYLGAPATMISALAAAPYPQGSLTQMDAPTTVPAFIDVLRNSGDYSLSKEDTNMQAFQALAARYSLQRCVAYEWGPHTHNASNQTIKVAAHLDADMGNLVKEIARKAWKYGWGMLCYYSLTPEVFKTVGTGGNWAASQSFATTEPKITALIALKSELRPAP
jgi:hypothetical protein